MSKKHPAGNSHDSYMRAVEQQLILDFYHRLGLSADDYRGPIDLAADAWCSVDPTLAPVNNKFGPDRSVVVASLQCVGHLVDAAIVLHDNPDLLLQRAEQSKHAGDYSHAQTLLERSLSLRPHSATAQRSMGHVLCALGRRQEAISAFNRATSILESPLYSGATNRTVIAVLKDYRGHDIYFEGGSFFATPCPSDSFTTTERDEVVVKRHRVPAVLRGFLKRIAAPLLIAAMREIVQTTWVRRIALATARPADLPHARELNDLLLLLRDNPDRKSYGPP